MEAPKPEKKVAKVIRVPLYGHSWPVYPMKSRGKDIFRVFHRVNAERIPKTFMTLAAAKADAKSILKELYGKGDSKIHLTEDEKRDWQAAMRIAKQEGIRSSLETVVRHYCDLAKIVGHASLLTDVARKYAESRGKTGTPVKLAALRDDYLEALKKRDCSVRHIAAQLSHTGQFLTHAGDVMSDQVTRELIQDFIDSKKGVDARTKLNLLDAVKAMMRYGKSARCVPTEWDEAEHVVAPAVMNALANDQRDRLGAICRDLKQFRAKFQFTFGQYIGETPEDADDRWRNAEEARANRLPGELVFRTEIRAPPPAHPAHELFHAGVSAFTS